MRKYFPRYGWSVSMFCFIFNYYVGIVCMFQVLTQALYPVILNFMGISTTGTIDLSADWSEFSLAYTCLIVLAIVLLLTAPRDTMYIKRVNAFGVFFIMIFITYIVCKGVQSANATEFTFSMEKFKKHQTRVNNGAET